MTPILQILPAPSREYTLKVLQFPRAVTLGKKQSAAKERQSPATVTWLYRQFVQGHLPRYPTSEQFITSSLPFLLRAMSPRAATIMAAVFGRRHPNIWNSDRVAHMTACSVQIQNLLPTITASLPGPITAALQTIQPRCRVNATTAAIICSSIANPKGEFFMDCRSLQRRLLLASPITALRVLQRLEKAGILQRLERGNTPWNAKADGTKRRANAFKVLLSNA